MATTSRRDSRILLDCPSEAAQLVQVLSWALQQKTLPAPICQCNHSASSPPSLLLFGRMDMYEIKHHGTSYTPLVLLGNSQRSPGVLPNKANVSCSYQTIEDSLPALITRLDLSQHLALCSRQAVFCQGPNTRPACTHSLTTNLQFDWPMRLNFPTTLTANMTDSQGLGYM